ncbi:MAG: hypothetical protein IJQ33_01425 [Clostridia bacterium]|nr:hypothetical protein [Clostridia bacterium]
MKREEDWLREACAELAQEETERWERGLTAVELHEAEEAYRRHRRKALSLIRRNTREHSPAWIVLRAAAVLLVLAGAMYLSLRQPPPDTVPQTHLSAATAAPYYSPVPTSSPSFATVWVFIPTSTPYSSESPMSSTTYTPVPEAMSTVSPTSLPTLEPMPISTVESTPVPTPEPTLVPTAEPTPAPSAVPSPPEGWTGNYFPMGLLDAAKPDISQGDGWQQAACDGWEFTEYTDDRVLDVPEGAEISYVQWADTVALRAETADGVTLIWVQESRSLRLFTVSGDAEEMAKSVKKFFEE